MSNIFASFATGMGDVLRQEASPEEQGEEVHGLQVHGLQVIHKSVVYAASLRRNTEDVRQKTNAVKVVRRVVHPLKGTGCLQ